MSRRPLSEAEQASVADVFAANRRFIECVAVKHAPSLDLVPDIVQTVGLKLCQSLARFEGRAQVQTWLYRVTVNTARDCYQREHRQRLAEARMTETRTRGDEITELDVDDRLTDAERADALHDAIGDLNDGHRSVILNVLRDPAVLSSRGRTTRHVVRRRLRDMLADDPRVRRQ